MLTLVFLLTLLSIYLFIVAWRANTVAQDKSHFVAPSALFDQEPRENPWVGFLQEPMGSLRSGSIGFFESYDPQSKNAPVYLIT